MRVLLVMILAIAIAGIAAAQTPAVPDTSRPTTPATAAKQPEMTTETPRAEPTLTIDSMAFCTSVEEREPVGAGAGFGADVGTLYFWSNVMNSGEPTTVAHVWYLNGEEKARVELPAKYPRNRVWSSKLVPPEWDGEWKVVVVDDGGNSLGTKICTVK